MNFQTNITLPALKKNGKNCGKSNKPAALEKKNSWEILNFRYKLLNVMKKSVFFVGLGNMGFPMARNLLKKGLSVQGFDLSAEKKEAFEAEGGVWAPVLGEAASQMDTLISMLPGGREIRELYIEKQNLLSFLKPGALIIDCTTADPETCREIHKEAGKKSLRMVFAPVSGGVAGAEAGTLTFMAGGEEKDLKEAESALRLMGRNIWRAGGPGDGQAVKICNNMLLAVHMIGTCEAFSLGEAMGIPPKTLDQIIRSSSGANWSLEKYSPCPGLMENVPSSRNYEGGFSVRLMLKDLALALDSIKKTGQKTEIGLLARKIYKKHFEDGHGKKDFSHVFQRYRKK